MSEKIKITTVGVPVGSNTRLRPVDMDHARDIVEYCGRGYTLGVQCLTTPAWHLTFVRYLPDRDWISRAYYNQDDARLHDVDVPDWIMKLVRLVNSIKPDTVRFHPPYAIEGAHHG